GVLREEPVAGVDRLDTLLLGERDDRLDVEVAANRLAGLADLVGLVGFEPVHGEPIFVRIDRDGANAKLVRRSKNSDGDLTAIGHQQLTDLGHCTVPGKSATKPDTPTEYPDQNNRFPRDSEIAQADGSCWGRRWTICLAYRERRDRPLPLRIT